ncbi:threonine synthase [Lentisphaera profundi]|uniref:Threonine synthase n=1 Tax=Lentisphaera profundi TaxID=1658616 RepID=A0ABY7VQB7_9BACT|nr:threonine synthase [Lentisphaera profundi]WDE95914.1 threonine synthase [Lentisphaera profundi]
MKYKSTRGQTEELSFMDAILTGQAPDGGLFLPTELPDFSDKLESWRGLSYTELAFEIMSVFANDIPENDLKEIIEKAYSSFRHEDIAPLAPVGKNLILELFHGPTLAFKDIALQFLGRVFDYILEKRDLNLNILAATSGDTGSAAIYGLKDSERVQVFVMHPHNRTSRIQALQMCTVNQNNIHNIAVEGSFDDCQAMMKDIFNQLDFKKQYDLGAVNSVNWGRLLAQTVYYFYAYFQATENNQETLSFSVPTGNFGDIFAGYLASKMGLPIKKLYLATNENDVLCRAFDTGLYKKGTVHHSVSPSMDIQLASNFERYLFYSCGQDSTKLRELMGEFKANGELHYDLSCELIEAKRCDTDMTLATIKKYSDDSNYVLDPHTATGVYVADLLAPEERIVCLATAHSGKFPESIKLACGEALGNHPILDALSEKDMKYQVADAHTETIKSIIVKTLEDA